MWSQLNEDWVLVNYSWRELSTKHEQETVRLVEVIITEKYTKVQIDILDKRDQTCHFLIFAVFLTLLCAD